jgi:GT2 family glycosyltransferase
MVRADTATDLSIVIVNWNSCALLRNCLQSVYEGAGHLNCEVIVVDNASYDGSEAMVEAAFPQTRFVQSTENLGFAAANNLGAECSHGRNLLFLNPDTRIVGGALTALVSALESSPHAGIVGARLLNSDFSLQASCVQAFPSIWNQVLDAEVLRSRFPKSALWGTRALFEDNPRPVAVDLVSGACLMIKRTAFEAIGKFTPGYFMYSEDVDLCYKARSAGWKTYYAGNATVIHLGGQSSRVKEQNNFAAIMLRESLRIFLSARRGSLHGSLYQFSMTLTAACRIALLATLFCVAWGRRRRDALRTSLAKWLSVFRWSIGLEPWAKRTAAGGR